MNESETIFRRFCESLGWRVRCVDPHSMPQGSNAPDFYLQPASRAGIVVEVKQFDPNPEEREAAQGRGSGVLGGKPGHRLRQVISKANNQLKALGRSDPGMLVVYNRTPCTLHDGPYAVLTAMRGLDVIEYYVPTDQGSPIPIRERPGPGKKLTREMNTSVSCIAVLRELFDGVPVPFGLGGPEPEYHLAVYHNPFAKHPLDPGHLVGDHVIHYRMNEEQTSWEIHPC